jgi:ACS family 4-hydroxyphenylacetate permease-like MFS transporter
MLLVGAQSDRSGERRRYCAVLMAVSAAGWLIVVAAASPVVKMAGLSVCYIGSLSAMAIFWTAANQALPFTERAVGIAAISTIGTFASILSPTIVGVLRDLTHSLSAGAWYSATLLVVGTLSLQLIAQPLRR